MNLGKSKSKILVISADYPGPDNLYGDVFVHTRLKHYQDDFQLMVIGYNPDLNALRAYTYGGIAAYITPVFSIFREQILQYDPDAIAVHLIQYQYMDFLLSLKKPIAIFIHGYEATSWYRRRFNYNAIGAFPYLLKYIKSNSIQLANFRKFVKEANARKNIHFVFVSNWIKQAASEDIGTAIANSSVIPNAIDCDQFTYTKKPPELRKKILLLRSFKARNYANDIAIEAILKLSTKSFFSELEFCVQGEGYLFKKLTERIKHFPNVELKNFFVENDKIPDLHKAYGIFLCPSRMDTQGVSMCEAMASGLVPITSNIGGIPEYCTDAVSGFLTASTDEIVQCVENLYNDPALFAQMSARASESIAECCSTEKVIQREINLIKSLAEPKQSETKYRQCVHCILDTKDDPEIAFDKDGVCSYCRNYEKEEGRFIKLGEVGKSELDQLIATIKKEGKDKPYDCIIGLSGGVDSTYLAYIAKKYELRPLAVHFDNGWNSELAVGNIENIITKLGFDLYTHVIDWEEFKNLQLAFLKASVIDIEMITDHAIMASLYKIAIDHKIKFILSGVNYATESILPSSWIHDKRDHLHIRAINSLFGRIPLKKYPLMNSFLKLRVEWEGIKSVALLNYFPYIKADVKKVIEKELQWRDYGGKHYESVFTRFYQGYILPVKFGVDKRKAHLSNLICARQITREEALTEIKKPIYPEAVKQIDYEFVLKKLDLSESEFQALMELPEKKHSMYPIDRDIYRRYPVLQFFSPIWKVIKQMRRPG